MPSRRSTRPASPCRSSSTPGSCRTSRSSRASIKAAFHVAHRAPGPCSSTSPRTSRRQSSTSSIPTRSICPGWKPPHEGAPAAARGKRLGRSPWRSGRSSTRAAACLNADACDELRELVDSARLPAVVTLMGKGCLRTRIRSTTARPDARLEVRELGAEQGRPRDRGRRALRRPRHGQGVGVRARREGDPLRRRRSGGRQDPPRGDPGRRPARSSRSRSSPRGARRCRAAARHEPWLRQLEEWREQFPFRYAKPTAC